MGDIKIGRMVLGMCQTNCYFVYRTGNPEAIVIDPADNGDRIADALERNGFRVAGVLLTHGHFDHIWGCEALLEAVKTKAQKDVQDNGALNEQSEESVKVYAGEAERELLQDARKNVSRSMNRPCTIEADVYVNDGEEITIAGITCKVLATPGHTIGGTCYYFEEGGFVVCGDTLFEESVGRTDLPTGSMGTLVRSIQDKLFTLPEETVAYPGHGDSTTIGHEKKYNPFCV
ncbi:MAG: MBL fold metallo-hydrolase [Lachnospiraceae bacterium]|nr:MBL fold metallo-hydrolase [Lachnospiraceae bacterium]